jgi:CDGSH-type Zn-finger protein
MNDDEPIAKKIVVRKNGPYRVYGDIPFVHKTQVVSEYGEPLTWRTDGPIATEPGLYFLCRCGESKKFPFCDGTHKTIGFDGSEPEKPGDLPEYRFTYRGGTRLQVRKNPRLCSNAGFCGMVNASLPELVAQSGNTQVRSLVMAMVERCPSGSLTYSIEPGEAEIEPDLPLQIAATTEITSQGPIVGPLWVMGGARIERPDGTPFVTRNRVTLCNCGHSQNKPFCDGAHRDLPQRQARLRGAPET